MSDTSSLSEPPKLLTLARQSARQPDRQPARPRAEPGASNAKPAHLRLETTDCRSGERERGRRDTRIRHRLLACQVF